MLRQIIRTNYAYGISVSRDIRTWLTCTEDSRLKFRNSPTVYRLPVSADCFVGLTGKWVNVMENVN
ncbi:hypothetical protein ALC56_01519 [Trachymyrmex septentrionalis]|uniref:Uncharacterized protein n=1 Tax=Trachymyrmex septentrionalis TaxID=34720 RepID=A0A195FU79_9HYME|nr:hypothetical protein ALC56_01519 [Trachymyrmex septentrionalis]